MNRVKHIAPSDAILREARGHRRMIERFRDIERSRAGTIFADFDANRNCRLGRPMGLRVSCYEIGMTMTIQHAMQSETEKMRDHNAKDTANRGWF